MYVYMPAFSASISVRTAVWGTDMRVGTLFHRRALWTFASVTFSVCVLV